MLNKHDKHDQAVVKRVSRKHDEDEHGGSWKVAFADFCLALMCLFMVLWVLAAREQESLEHVVRDAGASLIDDGRGRMPESMGGPRGSLIAHEPLPARGEPAGKSRGEASGAGEGGAAGRSRTRYESAAELQELARTLARLSEQSGLAGNVRTVVTPQGLRVMLHDTERQGMFQLGSAVPSEPFRLLLRRMGPLFAQIENQMLIIGHTDSLQYADASHGAFSNWTLSSNRAMSARFHLMAGGMRSDSLLQVVGMAEQAPLDVRDPAAGINRRIELLILTSEQARAIAAMFGMPRGATPLMDGVFVETSDGEGLRHLQGQLGAERGMAAQRR